MNTYTLCADIKEVTFFEWVFRSCTVSKFFGVFQDQIYARRYTLIVTFIKTGCRSDVPWRWWRWRSIVLWRWWWPVSKKRLAIAPWWWWWRWVIVFPIVITILIIMIISQMWLVHVIPFTMIMVAVVAMSSYNTHIHKDPRHSHSNICQKRSTHFVLRFGKIYPQTMVTGSIKMTIKTYHMILTSLHVFFTPKLSSVK